jgi:hypothetical protein
LLLLSLCLDFSVLFPVTLAIAKADCEFEGVSSGKYQQYAARAKHLAEEGRGALAEAMQAGSGDVAARLLQRNLMTCRDVKAQSEIASLLCTLC